jgi:hypothetical protein
LLREIRVTQQSPNELANALAMDDVNFLQEFSQKNDMRVPERPFDDL